MTESGLLTVQTWLWSKLDDLGIDGVIYSRHILDLLLSSKHTFDHRLDEKEQNIFSKIPPGFKKKKHKYSRRSSSFSAFEEILWKKEIAVACLLSAAETKADSENTAATIQHVVDELYSKLAGLHLTSDGKSFNSDDDCPLNDCNGNPVVNFKNPEKKEIYEDAFPSLDGTKSSAVSTNLSDSVWIKSEKLNELKSGRGSDNSFCPQLLGEEPCCFCCNNHRKGRFSPYFGSRSEGEATPDVKRRCNPPRNPSRRYINTRKPRAASIGRADLQMATVSQQSKKPPRSRFTHSTRFQSKYRKSGFQKKKHSGKSSPQKRKFTESKNTQHIQKSMNSSSPSKISTTKITRNDLDDESKNTHPIQKSANSSSPSKISTAKITRNDLDDVEQDYAHLPSWLETTLTNFPNPFIWNTFDVQENDAKLVSQEEGNEPKELAFSNRWYRESDSGLLTYQPLESTEEGSYSSSFSTTLSRSSSSLCEEEEEDEELFKDEASELVTPSPVPENWMYCPSPSLWEDGITSPVSRLQSVYKREFMSLGTERHVDDISGRFWEEYKTIFRDLQSMDAGTDDDEDTSSEDEQCPFEQRDSSVWGPSEMPYPANHNGGLPYSLRSVGAKLGPEALAPEFNMWSRPIFADIESTVKRNHNYDSLATSSAGEWPIPNGASSSTSIWNDPPIQPWSVDDGLDQSNNSDTVQPDEELMLLMQNGAFGYICPSREGECGLVAQKGTQHITQSTQWGGVGASAIERPETPEESSEEKMMHAIVDALFSDLLFGPDDEPHSNLDLNQIPSRTPVTPSFHNPFHSEHPTSVSFDFRSLFVQSPFQNFHSPSNNPWQPQWHLDDLVLRAGLTRLSPLIKLDDLFMSLASAEDQDHQYDRLGATTKKKKSFYDSVTENEAWRTSVRIGNNWQTISGIRPVNVIYSENKPRTSREEKLIPSSATHFRPITPMGVEGNDTLGYESTMTLDTSLTPDEPEFQDIGQDLSAQNIPGNNSNETDQIIRPEVTAELSFQTNFSKLVHDKSMQTAFDISVQQDISSCQEFLPRPPKASSR